MVQVAPRGLGTRVRKRVGRLQGRLIGTLVRVATQEPVVALTFDDGPDPRYTPQLLDILGRHEARATFFMIGKNAIAHPDVVKRVAGEGHTIGNHTWDHPKLPSLSPRERRAQIRACAEALGGHAQPFFRPPYSLQSVGSHLTARRLGYQVVGWNVEVEDWRGHDADSLTSSMLKRIKPGSVVVLHDAIWDPISDGAGDRGSLLDALRTVLERLGDRFRFVTVPELMRHGRPVWKPWIVRKDEDWE